MITEKQIAIKMTNRELQMLIEGLKAERDRKLSMMSDVKSEVELLDELRNIFKNHFMPKPKVEVVAPSAYQNPNEKREIS